MKKDEFIRKMYRFFRHFTISDEVALFIACQFSLESSFGSSNRSVTQHNLCGMKTPVKRLSAVSQSYHGDFMIYHNDLLCAIDYLLWLSYNHFNQTELQDLSLFKDKLIKCGYCPENDYVFKIETLFKQYAYVIET